MKSTLGVKKKAYCLTEYGKSLAVEPVNFRLAVHIARKYADKWPGLADDIHQAAHLGLADAIALHRPGRGIPLPKYAPRRIVGAIQDYLKSRYFMTPHRDGRRTKRDDRPAVGSIHANFHRPSMEFEMSEHGGDGYIPVPDRAPPVGSEIESADNVRLWLRGLTDVERFVVRKMFADDPWTKRRIAEQVGLSPAQIGHIYEKALLELRDRSTLRRFRSLATA